jgi:NAD+ kinase
MSPNEPGGRVGEKPARGVRPERARLVSDAATTRAQVRTAVLFTHSHPETISSAVREAVAAAAKRNCTVVASPDEHAKHGDTAVGIERTSELPERPDLCLVLGGDGTILKVLRTYAGTGVPVFGINFGTVGFLAAVEREGGLERALAGEFEVLTLPALRVNVDTEQPVALNDVSFIRRPQGRIAELAYRLGGQEVGHVRCDGLVAATPVGSTGYNLANQGPILAWGVKGFVVSFIAPHTLTARPLVVAPDDVLHVVNQAGREPVDVMLDGELVGELESGGETELSFFAGAGTLAQLPGTTFYHRIREKFGWLAH